MPIARIKKQNTFSAILQNEIIIAECRLNNFWPGVQNTLKIYCFLVFLYTRIQTDHYSFEYL